MKQKGNMHGNTIAGTASKAEFDNKASQILCETYSAIILGMDLPVQGASFQHQRDCLLLIRMASWKGCSHGADNARFK